MEEKDRIPASVSAVLDDELAAARTKFESSVSQLVADFGASGNRFGTALTHALRQRGTDELRNRAEIVVSAWRDQAGRPLGLSAESVLEAIAGRVHEESSDIGRFVLGISMGHNPVPADFLDQQLALTNGRIAAEVATLVANRDQVPGHESSAQSLEAAPSDVDSRLGLLRRERFDRDIAAAVTLARSSGEPLALVFLDVDRFKSINDTYGHQVGDEVLEAIAELLRRVVGAKGSCYRYGGEELTILLPNFTANEGAALAERARLDIAGSQVSTSQVSVTASFGVAELPGHAETEAELVKRADEALYQAKDLGRNLVRVCGEPTNADLAATPPARRRQPEPSALSDQQAEVIRQAHFTKRATLCPRDGAALSVRESHVHNRPTPDLMVYCPMCGLRTTIPGRA